MKRILGYLCTPIFFMVFGLLLGVFHPVQVICWKFFGYKAHKYSVDILNLLLVRSLWIMGAKIRFAGSDLLPANKPIIIIANHQSMFDIPPIVWAFRRHHVTFISKKELGRGIPSISYNLRKGGSALIDRNDRGQALQEIKKLGHKLEQERCATVIFPEGTRSRNGSVKSFKTGGIKALLAAAPSAYIVPFVIDGNYRLMPDGAFPLSFGVDLKYTTLAPFNPESMSPEEVALKSRMLIMQQLNSILIGG